MVAKGWTPTHPRQQGGAPRPSGRELHPQIFSKKFLALYDF